MSTASERAKDRRSLRLEFLEDRNLLSVVTPKGITAEVVRAEATPVTTITGHLQGLPATAGLYTPTLPGRHSYSGHGTARPLGNALFSAQEVETTSGSTVSITHGSAQLYDYKGDELFVVYTGTGRTARHKPTAISLTGSVTSGTHRFLNETGTFSATGNLNPASGRLVLNYTVVLSHPSV